MLNPEDANGALLFVIVAFLGGFFAAILRDIFIIVRRKFRDRRNPSETKLTAHQIMMQHYNRAAHQIMMQHYNREDVQRTENAFDGGWSVKTDLPTGDQRKRPDTSARTERK